jgi:hypothetical protein
MDIFGDKLKILDIVKPYIDIRDVLVHYYSIVKGFGPERVPISILANIEKMKKLSHIEEIIWKKIG